MKYILKNALVLNGHKDMEPTKNDLLIEDGKITQIGNNLEAKKAKVIDLNGQYVLPGLINLHVHLPGSGMPKDTKKQTKETVDKLMSNPLTRFIVYKLCEGYAKTEVLSGVTTIRTVGGVRNIDTQIRDNVNKGKVLGPRILSSNMAVTVKGGHMGGTVAYEASSIEDATNFLENEVKNDKIDWVKIMITGGVLDATKKGQPGELKMPAEYVKACCDKAHELGYKVAAHVESPEGVKVALENGVDSIEHGAKPDKEIIKLFKKTGAYNVCTLSCAVPFSLNSEALKVSELQAYNGSVVFNGIIDSAKACLENDIPVGLGTDTACPFVTHYDMWRELCYFVKLCGVDNKFALYTATMKNAEIAGLGEVTGSIDLGKDADLIVCSSNPLDNLSVLRKLNYVFTRGKMIKNPKIKKFDYVEKELDKYLGL